MQPRYDNDNKKTLQKYKYAMGAILVLIYSLFAVLTHINIPQNNTADDVIIIRFCLITLSTLLVLIALRAISIKSREFDDSASERLAKYFNK